MDRRKFIAALGLGGIVAALPCKKVSTGEMFYDTLSGEVFMITDTGKKVMVCSRKFRVMENGRETINIGAVESSSKLDNLIIS